MSGGIAYVFDADGSFASRCNPQLVGLDPLRPGDVEALRELVDEHLERTGSEVAARLLGSWERSVEQFVKVLPHDLARVLETPLSAGGVGFVTTETETEAAA
jgi:glutamate synthase (NADPH) large chain